MSDAKPLEHYESVSLEDVMQFFANAYKSANLARHPDGSVRAEWLVDPTKGEVIFRLWIKSRREGSADIEPLLLKDAVSHDH